MQNIKPRAKLIVRKSNKYIYAQIVDPKSKLVAAGAGGRNPEEVGAEISKLAGKLKFKKIIFDRGGSRFHGQVKKLAEAAKKGGLEF